MKPRTRRRLRRRPSEAPSPHASPRAPQRRERRHRQRRCRRAPRVADPPPTPAWSGCRREPVRLARPRSLAWTPRSVRRAGSRRVPRRYTTHPRPRARCWRQQRLRFRRGLGSPLRPVHGRCRPTLVDQRTPRPARARRARPKHLERRPRRGTTARQRTATIETDGVALPQRA